MPKVISQAVMWLPERSSYVIHEEGNSGTSPLPDKKSEWYAWLAARSSFAFEGRHGHLTLRKESRARRDGYWYAYRCHDRRTVKRYAGRTHDLNVARLEEIAREITAAFEQPQQNTEKAPEGELTEPLLISRLRLPRLSGSLIVRERLLLRLDATLERRLTLLCAPAGTGKTTLVRQWIAARSTGTTFPPVAWISLDVSDNDPLRFWRSVLTACQAWFPATEQHALHALLTVPHPAFHTAPFQPRSLEAVLTGMLNDVTRGNRPGLLVLDDYHLISEARVHETLGFFLAHLPETLHIVLIARQEPPLSLARLRANGDLNEIRAADLRFSREETAAFLQDFPLSPEDLARLDSRLEGWAAGLRLLSLSLQHTTNPAEIERLLTTFSGSHRPVLDYFVSEVLHTQTEKVQEFLLRTSLLPRLSPSLCTAVTGYQESAILLETIERANLFLEALDGAGEWYRYHALFAEAMQHEARRRLNEEELHELFRVASRWFEQHDLFSEAIEAALKARDYERAADLIEHQANVQNFLEPQEHLTMHRWLEQLPEELLHQRPSLCFSYAATLVFNANNRQGHGQVLPARAEDLLRRAEEGWRASNDFVGLGKLFAFRTLLTFEQKKRAEAVAYARQALACLPETEVGWRSFSLMTLGAEAILKGQLNEARRLYQQANALWQTTGSADAAIGTAATLGIICFSQGDLHQAASYYRQFADGAARSEDHPAAAAPLGLALVHYEWNELEVVEQQIQTALERGERLTDTGPQEFLSVPLGLIQA
ncbi:MAG: AAA family ATPase, partial [Ktedonobacteraceae bacterium]|nr:AAA family ATPase [Ktedonobacteraceae bacterium]